MAVNPGRFEGHAKRNPVALADGFAASGGGHRRPRPRISKFSRPCVAPGPLWRLMSHELITRRGGLVPKNCYLLGRFSRPDSPAGDQIGQTREVHLRTRTTE